jgi:hypothetical protein
MTRNHRAAHRLFWPLAGLLAAFALLMALLLRTPEAQSATNIAVQDLAR